MLALCAGLAAFALWGAVLLGRAQVLQGELDDGFAWLDLEQEVQDDLERWRTRSPTDATVASRRLERLRSGARRLAAQTGEREMVVAAEQLDQAVPGLAAQIEADAGPDEIWRAASSVHAAAVAFEKAVERRVAALHRLQAGTWRAMAMLGLVALLLAVWNILLLLTGERRREELEMARAEARRSASHDALTGLWNRDAILSILRHELFRAQRTVTPFGVVLLDIEDFRSINSFLGQTQGDEVLREVGGRIGALVRPYDTMGRWGGDTFLLVLPNCDENATDAVTERLLAAVNGHDVEHSVGKISVRLRAATLCVRQPEETTVERVLLRLEETMRMAREASGKMARPTF